MSCLASWPIIPRIFNLLCPPKWLLSSHSKGSLTSCVYLHATSSKSYAIHHSSFQATVALNIAKLFQFPKTEITDVYNPVGERHNMQIQTDTSNK